MLRKKILLYFPVRSNQLTTMGRNAVHHIHFKSIKHENFHKIVHKTSGYSNPVLSHSSLKALLQDCKSVTEQTEAFFSFVELPKQDVSDRLLLAKDIENALKTTFPESFVNPVGSSVSGLGFRGCDLDLSFHYLRNNPSANTVAKNIVVTNVDVISGKVPASDFPLLPVKQQLLFLQKELKKAGIADDAIVVPGRHPILNFNYSGYGCDLSINNRLAVYGTQLMQICSMLDHRVRPLFQLITYWGKHYKLIGGPVKFKSYAVFLMIVYFLQTRLPPILPPIQDILHKIGFEENMKNVSSDEIHKRFQFPANNFETIENLLREFFFFYANFDFSSVICCLDVNLEDGKSLVLKEPAFELNTIKIQDPIILERNVTATVDWKNSSLFLTCMLSACEAYHEISHKPIKYQNWGLLAILNRPFPDHTFATKETIKVRIPLTDTYVPDCEKLKFLSQACDKVFSIFKECLLFQCDAIDSKNIKSKIKNSDFSNKKISKQKQKVQFRNSDEKEKVTIDKESILLTRSMYVTVCDTWRGRNNFSNNIAVKDESSFVAAEQQISRRISEQKNVDNEESFTFLCECNGVSFDNNDFLNITLRPVNRAVFIPKLGIILKEYILNYFHNYYKSI